MGIVSIVQSLAVTRKSGSKVWIFQLIIGILAVLVGILSFFQPMIMAVSIGILISIFFIETGLTLIMGGAAEQDSTEK